MSDATFERKSDLDKNEKNTIYSIKKIQACRGIGSAFVCPPPERRSMAFKRSGVRLPYAPPYLRNPNLIQIGDGFGFLLFLSSVVV